MIAMKYCNSFLSRSHKGYTKLVKSEGSPEILKIVKNLVYLLMVNSPYGLLPVTLLYLSCPGWIPSYLLVLIIFILFMGVLYQAQDALLYHPSVPDSSKLYVATPPQGVPYEEVEIGTDDNVTLQAYFIKQPGDLAKYAPTLLCFHGNAGSIGSPSYYPLYVVCKVNLLLIEYRGYGRNQGQPSEHGFYMDGAAGLRYLAARTDIDVRKIVLFGHSLGGAVAIHLAALTHRPYVAGLIVENTFTSIRDAGSHMFRSVTSFLSSLPTFMYKNKYDSLSKIGEVKVPIMVICGDKDEILPSKMSQKLCARNKRWSVLCTIPNAGHNDTWCTPKYARHVAAFLQKYVEQSTVKASVSPSLQSDTSRDTDVAQEGFDDLS